MGLERALWLFALGAPPGAVLVAYLLGLRGRGLKLLAAGCACAAAALSAAPLVLEVLRGGSGAQGPRLLSIVLVPFSALLWLVAVAVTPSGRLDDAGLSRNAAACALEIAAFMTVSPWLILFIWAATSALLAAAHGEERFSYARRVLLTHLGLSTLLLAAGIALKARGPGLEQWGVGLILAAVVVRKGLFPFHAWIPEVFDRGRIGPFARFNATQLGTYAALVLAVPRAGSGLLRAVAILALVTAVYGALLALYEWDARRACGYLFVSQSALVLAGLDLAGREALTGALVVWVSSGLALAGLSRAVLALEARRGRLRLDVRHGGYERMPQLAACFLVMSLAIANFPGTLGFVGGEMLVRGTMDLFPVLGLFAVAATALNGLAAIRMYFSLFCGRKDFGAHLKLGRGEGLGFAAAALVLVGLGLAPAGLVGVLHRAGSFVIQSRQTLGASYPAQ